MLPDHHIVQHAHFFKQADVLECAGDPQPVDLMPLIAVYACAFQQDLTRRRLINTTDDIKAGGLARAVWAEQSVDLAFLDLHGQPVNRLQPAELHGNIVYFQQFHILFNPLPARRPARAQRCAAAVRLQTGDNSGCGWCRQCRLA